MSNAINLTMQGRFGNQLFQYAFARAYAEKHGLELRTEPWIGQRIWEINDPPIGECFPRVSETEIVSIKCPLENIEIRGYFQQQLAMIYTREQSRRWFSLRPDVKSELSLISLPDRVVAHQRFGDYFGYGYPVISLDSYKSAFKEFGFEYDYALMLSEETAITHVKFSGDLLFMPDFYQMMNAGALFRANSSFSWWAATLGTGEVFSPVIEGLAGGQVHDVRFVRGNHPRFANLDFVTDLHLPE